MRHTREVCHKGAGLKAVVSLVSVMQHKIRLCKHTESTLVGVHELNRRLYFSFISVIVSVYGFMLKSQ